MTKDLLFWILMLLWLVLGAWAEWTPGQSYPMRRLPGSILLLVLLGLLGWRVFGAAVR